MDKNTVIGFLLIGVVLFAFTWLNQPSQDQIDAQRRYNDSIAQVEFAKQAELRELENKNAIEENAIQNLPDSAKAVQLQNTYGAFAGSMEGEEEIIKLENNLLEVHITTKGGRLAYARLKEYVTHDSLPLILFQGNESKLDFTLITAHNRVINTSDMYFTPVKGNDPNAITMRLNAGEGSLDFTYSLKPDDYMVQYTIQGHGLNGILSPSTNAIDMVWEQDIRQQEKGRKYEDQHTALYYKFMADDVEHLSEGKDQSEKVSNRLKWIAYKDKFFSSVLIADEGFEATTLDSKQLTTTSNYLKKFKTVTSLPFDLQGREPTNLRYYLGPNHYTLLKKYDKDVAEEEQLDLEKLVPMGGSVFRVINRYFIVPVFDWLGKYFTNYGLIIFLLTLIVKMVLFPLTYKSYMSSAKMRVLRPQVEEINAKYPGQEKAMERQKETMALYSKAGASPLSGCLPMLLQFPILVALYNFFPSAIELRQQSFLWAQDLSTYDAIVTWNAQIPLISTFLGNHLSLFCILMTAVNIVYTKFNMEMTNTGQQQMPGMKMMMYMMPLMFLFFFNQSAAALSYYFLVSTLITIAQTLSFRFLINEDKLLAKLEANKKKPKKKSGFMQRLEEAQKQQQAVLEKQKQQKQQQSRKKR